MTQAKPFQKATVAAIVAVARSPGGSKRLLLADEVGLGKTVVTQLVLAELSKGLRRPLNVVYVASNLTIANQNRGCLVEFLPEEERSSALCTVDRLTLLPVSQLPTHSRLRVFTLTPDTSIPLRKGRRRDGRKDERALLHVLFENTTPQLFDERGAELFRRQAKRDWARQVARMRPVAEDLNLIAAFRRSLRRELGLAHNARSFTEALRGLSDLELIARARNALAACGLERINVDVVVFDEFHRFRDLVDPTLDPRSARVLGPLRGEGKAKPSLQLLLSATPYRLYSRRNEDQMGASHRAEFLELVEFLHGGGEAAKATRVELEQVLRRSEEELLNGRLLSEEAARAREEAKRILGPVILRTERASHPDGWVDQETRSLPTELHGKDLRVFRHFNECLAERHRGSGVSYWRSMPLPMQTLNAGYAAFRSAGWASTKGVPVFTKHARDRYVRQEWAHPKLRALKKVVPVKRLALPWIAPSLPWWGLDGAWKGAERQSKVLLFSRFRAVPPGVSALLSYDLESSLLRKGHTYPNALKKPQLTPSLKTMALFHPSPWLAEVADPLQTQLGSPGNVRRGLKAAIRTALGSLGVRVRKVKRRRPLWKLLARLDRRSGRWSALKRAWLGVAGETSTELGRLVARWGQEAAQDLEWISATELRDLTEHALSGVGIAFCRAARRHWAEAVGHGLALVVETAWNGLRTYLDQPWFVKQLGRKRRKQQDYADDLRLAVVQGGLESLLDEQLWVTRRLRSLTGAQAVAELQSALRLRTSSVRLHDPSQKGKQFALRCHAAMPFTGPQTRSADDDRPLRPDELRRGFNSPFWPHVLATTSVGQEGLDFHVWCKTLVHWDLCGNPVDLEQREGRIQRHAGLANRREIARRLRDVALKGLLPGQSPWARAAELSDQRLADASGLSPWWVCKGAEVQRYVLELPSSSEVARLAWLRRQRMLYRLVLGQPNQEDLVESLERFCLDPNEIREATVGLSPYFDGPLESVIPSIA